ncbi:MAG: FAD-dependent oxidoreductase, partial [Dietzia cercidiphylli]
MSAAFDTVIIGGGNAGISLAARLRRDGRQNIALVDPSPVHRYRPMLNYAATGLAPMRRYERAMTDVVPAGVHLLPHLAGRVDTDAHTVTLGPREEGPTITYEDLVVCPGLTARWDAIPGLDKAYVAGW